MDQGSLQDVKDEEVPGMLFLSVSPGRVEEGLSQVREETDQVASTFTDTDASVFGGDYVPSLPAVPTSDDEMDPTAGLLEKFKMALEEQSITPLRGELQQRLSKLSVLQLQNEDYFTLEDSLSHDDLTRDEEDVLVLAEIFEQLKHPVPKEISEKFNAIVAGKKIPVWRSKGSEKKIFFVYAENKILMEVCSSLSPPEVHEMYRIVKDPKGSDQDDAVPVTLLTLPDVPPEAMQKVAGLKDVAFYYLVLSLMRKKKMNRLYTHELDFLLAQLRETHEKNKQEHAHIDRALAALSRYPLASRPPGLCLIFNMLEGRKRGAGKDQERVEDLFKNVFKYDVITRVDPTAKEIEKLISKLKAPKYKYYDSLVVWVMCHGSKSHFLVKDGEIHRRRDLIDPLSKIEWFNKKPKLFFIQACADREKRKRYSWLVARMQEEDSHMSEEDLMEVSKLWREIYGSVMDVSNTNTFADTLVCYATMWYQKAARGEQGSLYVHTLVDQLEKYGRKESIENVLRRVNYIVNPVNHQRKVAWGTEVWKQTPYYENSLQKEFIFPQHYTG